MAAATLNRTSAFEHSGRHGTRMISPRIDLLKCEVVLRRPIGLSDAKFAADVAEIMGWWTVNIYPQFIEDGEGYSGFDTIQFKVVGYQL